MLQLYEANELTFEANGETLPEAFNAKLTHYLNGEYSLEFYLKQSDQKAKQVEVDKIVFAEGQPFRIVMIAPGVKDIHVYAVHVFFDLRDYQVEAVNCEQTNGYTVMQAIFSGAGTNFTYSSDITKLSTMNEEKKNIVEMLQIATERYEGELVRNKFDVRLNNRVGVDTEHIVYVDKNVATAIKEVDVKDVCTRAIIEYGSHDEPKRVIVTSENINLYSHPKTRRYQNITDDIQTEQQAIDWGLGKFKGINRIDVPKVAVEIDLLLDDSLKTLNIGDTVICKIPNLNLDERIQIIGYAYDPLLERKTKIYAGYKAKGLGGSIIGGAVEAIRPEIADVDKDLQAKIDAANAAIDKEYNDRVQAVNDAIAKAEADAEVMKKQIVEDIQADFITFNKAWADADKKIDDKLSTESDRITTEISDRKTAVTNAINAATTNAKEFADTVQGNLDALGSASTTQKIHGNAMVTGTLGADKIIANSITASQIAAGAITANLMAAESVVASTLKVDQAFIDKLTVTNMLAKKITADALFATTVQTVALNADKITAGILDANLIKVGALNGDRITARTISADKIIANSITAGEINAASIKAVILTADAVVASTLKVDQALITKLTTGDLLTKSLTAKQAWITSANIVSLEASSIKGKVLSSTNGGLKFDLDGNCLWLTENSRIAYWNSNTQIVAETRYGTNAYLPSQSPDINNSLGVSGNPIAMSNYCNNYGTVTGVYQVPSNVSGYYGNILHHAERHVFATYNPVLGFHGAEIVLQRSQGENPIATQFIPRRNNHGIVGNTAVSWHRVYAYGYVTRSVLSLEDVNYTSEVVEFNALDIVNGASVEQATAVTTFDSEVEHPNVLEVRMKKTLKSGADTETLNSQIAILWKAVQELSEQNRLLQEQINELKGA
ncbi:MAG: phage tail spike protein [Culicoidibacterales bacterium]